MGRSRTRCESRCRALVRVAGLRCGRYSGIVRRLTSQRALIWLLLGVRLLFGGPADAMPHTPGQPDSHAHRLPATDSAGVYCPSHDADSDGEARRASPDDLHYHSAPSDEGDHDCCKTGSCECPCTHVAAYIVILATSLAGSPCRLTALDCIVGPPCDRASLLFRPPA
jgi:hypothetical protein